MNKKEPYKFATIAFFEVGDETYSFDIDTYFKENQEVINVEETEKNGQEDTHYYGCFEWLAEEQKWRVEFKDYTNNYDHDIHGIEDYLNKHNPRDLYEEVITPKGE